MSDPSTNHGDDHAHAGVDHHRLSHGGERTTGDAPSARVGSLHERRSRDRSAPATLRLNSTDRAPNRTSFLSQAGQRLLRTPGAASIASTFDGPLSPVRSFYGGLTGSNLRDRRRNYDDNDYTHEQTAFGNSGNGVRTWYESYTTIDWIHDSIKESSRLRRIRRLRGLRGKLVNSWDRFQGWLIVTITGIITALIAGCIVKSEAVLFDLKEGYCERDWRLAKRFCCPYAGGPDWDSPSQHLIGTGAAANVSSSSAAAAPLWSYHTRLMNGGGSADPTRGMLTGMGNRMLAGWAAPVAGSPAWAKIAAKARGATVSLLEATPPSTETEECPGWITWAERFRGIGHDSWLADYGMYVVIAVLWASIASILTIYLTSSELYLSSKNYKATSPPPTDAKKPDGDGTAAPANSSGEEPNERTALLGDPFEHANGSGGNDNATSSQGLGRIGHDKRAEAALPPRKVLYFATGSGISEVKCILSGFVIHGYLGFWTLFTKSVGLTLSVASGLSLGKEGPFVHIASCVGNIVCRIFPKYENNEGKRREILSCACAAGVAVAFGAPVGGVLFSLEEVSYYFPSKVMFRSFFCAMVAAATLRAIDPFGTGKIVLFQVTYDKDWHFYEMLFFILIGVFGGLYGAYFTKLNMAWAKKVRAKTWMATHPILEVVMITVVSVAFSYINGYTRMGGVELIADLFSECHEHESLEGLCVSSPSEISPLVLAILWAMLIKGALTIITFGIKLPAGIFIPTLAVGACFGRVVGLLVQYVQWTHPDAAFFGWCESSDSACIVPGVYAMVGAAAALSGVTRTTVSLAVIMFELTGTLTYSVPVMLSILVAKTIADALEHKGIYDLVIDFSGLPYLDSKAEYIWESVNVTDAMDTEVETISLDGENTVASLRDKLQRLALGSGYTDGGFPIITHERAAAVPNPHLATSSLSTNSPLHSPTVPQHPATRSAIKMVGYLAASELDHALSRLSFPASGDNGDTAPLASGETKVTFRNLPYVRAARSADGSAGIRDSVLLPSHPVAAAGEDEEEGTTLDLSVYVDKAPITVQIHSPLELVHQYFTRLGVRYLVVVDESGGYRGVVFKKRYLKFLADMEEQQHGAGGH